MGRKSRLKKLRREKELTRPQKESRRGGEFFLFEIIRFSTYLALFTPLIVSSKTYFPFVGLKSLYFMGLCEIVFFSWLILILNYPKYRPKFNSIFLALSLFLVFFILSAVFGVDPSRSFWSKYERMTGVLMWLHLFGFFLVLSSVFKKVSDWEKFFIVSIFVAILISSWALFEKAGIKDFKLSPRMGATLGNTSFLGTYLLFNAYLALWIFFQKRNWGWKIYSLGGIGPMFSAIYLSDARAATYSFLGGLIILFFLWLAFKQTQPQLRLLGKLIFIIIIFAMIAATILLLTPGSFVEQKFRAMGDRGRIPNWEMARKAFLEHPLLGWGPENYTIVFTKYFNPCLFTKECGREIWFDRTHNIILDTLVTQGILGLIAYFGIFVSFFYVLWKKYLKEKFLDFWTLGIFTVLFIAYFVQNLTVFDMVTSLMMFFLILGFGGFLANLKKEEKEEVQRNFIFKHQWLAGLLVVAFCLSFWQFVLQPARADALVIKALQGKNSQERIELYKKTLETSPLGKYQIREFFAQQSQNFIQNNLQKIPKEEIKKELDFLISELQKTEKESPGDYRSILRLAHLYNLYALVDQSKLTLAEKYGKRCIELSPTNQQSYWVLAQTKLYQRDFETALRLAQKAIDLEPRWLQSHKIAVQIAQFSGDQELARELAKKAIEINPDWEKEFKDLL